MKTPNEILHAAVEAGARKAALSDGNVVRLLVSAAMAGCFIGLGGILSIIVGYGFPELTAANPALQKLLSGLMFPVGLVLIVILGAELFTGNNALLIPSMLQGRHSAWSVLKNWALVYAGNFVGVIAFTWLMVYVCGLSGAEPWRSAIVGIAQAKVAMSWPVVFLKGIGANWCVCLAVWLALSSGSTLGKMAGCWIPVMAFVALGYEHSIANMFFIPLGMMEGADIGVWESIHKSFIPATLGNIVGGALMVGAAHYYIHFRPLKK